MTDIAGGNFTDEAIRRAEGTSYSYLVDLVRNSQIILRQLQEESKLTQDDEERLAILEVAELILDMVLLNERQARTGSAEIDQFLVDRGLRPIEKRVGSKIMSLKEVRRTEFF